MIESQEKNKKKKLPYYDSKIKNTHEEIVNILSPNFNIQKKREFVERKKEYLEKNKVMSDEEFKELFWNFWKYGKSEIYQNNRLWLCYSYTSFEMLKKCNFFRELIQTNFKRIWEWKWEVKIPFCDSNWYWIKVDINEIYDENWKDRLYSFIPRKSKWGNWKTVKITSWSSLWFKILEIAFMKSYLVFNPKYLSGMRFPNAIQSRWIFNLKWDFELISQSLRDLEMWNTWQVMQHLFGTNIVKYNDPDEDKIWNLQEIIKEFNTWFVKIALTSKAKEDKFLGQETRVINRNNMDIWDNSWNKKDLNWKKQVFLSANHVYSVEKFYNTPKWEIRVRIVNPWNTSEKIDMPIEQCKEIFNWQIIWFDIDKMFR